MAKQIRTLPQAIRALVPSRFPTNKAVAAAAGITEAALYILLGGGSATGDTLAKLQAIGCEINKHVIASQRRAA